MSDSGFTPTPAAPVASATGAALFVKAVSRTTSTLVAVVGTTVRRSRTTRRRVGDRKSTRLNSSHANISYAVFCLKKKITTHTSAIPSSHLTVATTAITTHIALTGSYITPVRAGLTH